MLLLEDIDFLLNPPLYPATNNFGIKQIDVNESIYQNNAVVLFLNGPGKSPVLKVFKMDGVQIGSDFNSFEISDGVYIFSINYLSLKMISGLTVGSYLIEVSVDQVSDYKVVEITSNIVQNTASGGFR